MTTEVQSPISKSPFSEYMEEQLEILAKENDTTKNNFKKTQNEVKKEWKVLHSHIDTKHKQQSQSSIQQKSQTNPPSPTAAL